MYGTRTSSVQLSNAILLYFMSGPFSLSEHSAPGYYVQSIKLTLRTALMHQLITAEMYLDTFCEPVLL